MAKRQDNLTPEQNAVLRELLQRVVNEKNLSQTEIGDRIGLGQQAVSAFLNGRMGIGYVAARRAAELCGVSLADLGISEEAPASTEAQNRWKAALIRALDPDVHDFDDAAALRQMINGEAFDNFTDAELADACRELLNVATKARRTGERLSPSILIAGLIRRLLPVPYALAQAQAPAPALRMVAESGPKAVLPNPPGDAEGSQAQPRPKTTKAHARKRRPG